LRCRLKATDEIASTANTIRKRIRRSSMMGKGYVHVYTGDGKGKTTSALGLLVRAYGDGARIFLGQFLKGNEYSELVSLKMFSDRVTVRQYGSGRFVQGEPTEEDRRLALEGFGEAREALLSGKYELVILDEANVAVRYGLLRAEDLINLIDSKPDGVELIITGRGADPRVIERADLVTEMREVKHYYQQGVLARKGVEK
jgi:cob(I)alamin adenosyltransferase